jgi:hypothetical protein
MARTSCMLMRWRWCPLCTRATCLVWILFYSTNSLKQQWAEKCRPTQSHYPNSKFLLLLLKGILSTSCVFFSYPKLLSISVLTFIKWRLTPSYAAKDTIFWQKRPKTIVIRIIVWMTIFKSIHMAFYVNTSWACALFRNNKQHVVLGQKRNCQRVEESGLWRIQRERWIEEKYLPNGTNAGYM